MLLRFALWVLGFGVVALPRSVRALLGRGLGAILRGIGVRRSVVLENIQRCFPGSENEELRTRLLGSAYRHLGLLIFEILALFGPFDRFVRQNTRLKGLENWQRAHAAGPVIFLSSHIGNWELMAGAGALLGGMDLLIVTKRLKPASFHDGVVAGRARARVKCAFEPQTMRGILKQLDRRETVGFVLDQYAGPPVSVRVPFFGTPVGTSTALAMLAKRSGAQVIPVTSFRDLDGVLVVRFEPALTLAQIPEEPQRELAEQTAQMVAWVESQVREFPDQWLWTHRRFKGDLGPLRPGEWDEHRARG